MAKRVAGHDPLLSGIQPHRLMWSTDTFQMPSLTIRGAYDTGNLKELIIDLEEKLPYECVEFNIDHMIVSSPDDSFPVKTGSGNF